MSIPAQYGVWDAFDDDIQKLEDRVKRQPPKSDTDRVKDVIDTSCTAAGRQRGKISVVALQRLSGHKFEQACNKILRGEDKLVI